MRSAVIFRTARLGAHAGDTTGQLRPRHATSRPSRVGGRAYADSKSERSLTSRHLSNQYCRRYSATELCPCLCLRLARSTLSPAHRTAGIARLSLAGLHRTQTVFDLYLTEHQKKRGIWVVRNRDKETVIYSPGFSVGPAARGGRYAIGPGRVAGLGSRRCVTP